MEITKWLEILAVASLSLAGACALTIVLDLLTGHSQHMWIMNIVWPVTALYFGPLALYAYFRWGRLSAHHAFQHAKAKTAPAGACRSGKWSPLARRTAGVDACS
jgi:hypothetical protein